MSGSGCRTESDRWVQKSLLSFPNISHRHLGCNWVSDTRTTLIIRPRISLANSCFPCKAIGRQSARSAITEIPVPYISVRLHEQGNGTGQPTEGLHTYWTTEVSGFFPSKGMKPVFPPRYSSRLSGPKTFCLVSTWSHFPLGKADSAWSWPLPPPAEAKNAWRYTATHVYAATNWLSCLNEGTISFYHPQCNLW